MTGGLSLSSLVRYWIVVPIVSNRKNLPAMFNSAYLKASNLLVFWFFIGSWEVTRESSKASISITRFDSLFLSSISVINDISDSSCLYSEVLIEYDSALIGDAMKANTKRLDVNSFFMFIFMPRIFKYKSYCSFSPRNRASPSSQTVSC